MNSQPVQAFLNYIQRKKEVVLFLAISLLLIGFIDALSTKNLEQDQIYRQTLMAEQLRAQLQSSLKEHLSGLNALNVVYQNFVDISQYDFQQYGESITTNLPGYRRLMYVDPTYHVRRIYPLSPENMHLFGTALSENSQYSQLLTQAKTSGQLTISDLSDFKGHPGSVLDIQPIYRNNREFLGYAVGELSVEKIWEPLSHADFLHKFQIQLKDPAGHNFFTHVHLSSKNMWVTSVSFQVANHRWTIELAPIYPIWWMVLVEHLVIWAVGLLIILLVGLLVTRSRRYRQIIGEAQHQFETIFNASPDGILMLDDKLQLKLTNPPVRTWSGFNEHDLGEKTFFDLFTCQCPNLDKCRELSFLLCTSDQFDEALPEVLETQITNPHDGLTRTLRLNASKVDQSQSKQNRSEFICVLGDISTRKEMERMKETYVATLTHDLKTPLVAQQLVLNTLLSGKAGKITAQQKTLISGASTSVHDLLEMVHVTLLYYKLESSGLQLHRQLSALEPLIKDVMESLSPLLDKRNLSFELEAALDVNEARVDVIQIKRVFHNILSNAISYSARDTAIQVSIRLDEEGRLLVEIRNQGKGIPESELPKIFDKYYSLSRRFKQIGTGLGLYISRRIVELHGGKIWAISVPDGETCFYISLPSVKQI